MIVTVQIVRTSQVEVEVESFEEAREAAQDMYLSGDAGVQLGDAQYIVVKVED